jgi:hypothetical protein
MRLTSYRHQYFRRVHGWQQSRGGKGALTVVGKLQCIIADCWMYNGGNRSANMCTEYFQNTEV